MKKILLLIISIFSLFSIVLSFGWWTDFPYDNPWSSTSDTKQIAKDNIWNSGLLDKLLSTIGINNNIDWATGYISMAVNYFLWIVAFIALIVVIIWFMQMLTSSEHDESFQKAKKYVKNWSIAILVMWVSWFIVSFVFHIIWTAI